MATSTSPHAIMTGLEIPDLLVRIPVCTTLCTLKNTHTVLWVGLEWSKG